MKLYYKKSQSSVYPELVDTTSSRKVVYLRKDVVEVETTDEFSGETHTYYEYDEAKITKAEYQIYLKELNATETIENIDTLKEENERLKTEVAKHETTIEEQSKEIENLKNENVVLTETSDMLTSCIIEMSEMLYA